MKIRSTYFKVQDVAVAVAFWRSLLQLEPVKESTHWAEFLIGEVRLGFLLNDFGETISGNSTVPVLELEPFELKAFVERAKSLGATTVLDGLDNPKMNSIVMAAPSGHEFELCNCK
jgi:catechol 2,3-dioxygenase-like lactoylglutathione lyase family enzyme